MFTQRHLLIFISFYSLSTAVNFPQKPGASICHLEVENESNCKQEDYCQLVASLSARCPKLQIDGYKAYATGRYKVYLDLIIWENAKRACEKDGAYLTIIDSQEEVDVLREVVQASTHIYTWIGTSKNSEGAFIDLFGKPVKPFWAPDQPDNYQNNENCGCLTREGLMNDCACRVIIPYICEKNYF